MAKDPLLSFFHSWNGVLAPDAIVMARKAPHPDSNSELSESPAHAGFLFVVPGASHPDRADLWSKVLGALGLAPSEYGVSESSDGEGSALVTVRLELGAGDPPQDWAERDGAWSLSTYSLEAMLVNPGLKKPVWEGLKEALRRGRGERWES